MHQELTEKIQAELLPIFDNAGVDLVHFSLRTSGPNGIIDILADRPEGGITIDVCADLNKKIVALVEEKNLFPQGFTVEVASPGVDWPLTTARDFRRVLGRAIRLSLNEPVAGQNEYVGKLAQVDLEDVILQPFFETKKSTPTNGLTEQRISIHNIRKAIQIV